MDTQGELIMYAEEVGKLRQQLRDIQNAASVVIDCHQRGELTDAHIMDLEDKCYE